MKTLRIVFLIFFLGMQALLASPLRLGVTTGWGLLPVPWPDYAGFYPRSTYVTGGPLAHVGASVFFSGQKLRAGLGLSAGLESWVTYKALASEQREYLFPFHAVFHLETGLVSFQAAAGPGIFQRRVLTSERLLLQETQIVPSMAFSVQFDFRLGKDVLLPVGLRVAGMIAPGAGSSYSPILRLLLTPTFGIAFRL